MGCRQSKTDLLAENEDDMKSSSPIVISSCPDLSDQYFSQHQKTVLRETWKLIDGENHGIAIFLRIFERNPTAQHHFPFRGLSVDDLLQNPAFRAHATRFMHAIGTTIKNLDALDVALIPILYRLGEVHGWISGFMDVYLPVFISSILDTLFEQLGDKVTADVREAWVHLGEFISEKLKEGYKLQEKQSKEMNKQDRETDQQDTEIIKQDKQTDMQVPKTDTQYKETDEQKKETDDSKNRDKNNKFDLCGEDKKEKTILVE